MIHDTKFGIIPSVPTFVNLLFVFQWQGKELPDQLKHMFLKIGRYFVADYLEESICKATLSYVLDQLGFRSLVVVVECYRCELWPNSA
jgi:hypothetical protein